MSEPGLPAATRPQAEGRPLVAFSCLSLAVWAAAAVLLWSVHGALLNWDEVDYVNAAKLGPWANAFERGSLSPSQFFTFALTKMSGKDPVLPPGYDESRDPLLLRHYHPPFVVLLLSAVSLSRSERVIRSVQLLGALAFACSILLSYWSISGSTRWPGMLLTSLLALWMIRLMFSSVSFHGWEAVLTTTTAALMGRWLGVRRRALGVLLCASLALAVLTLETGLLVWAGAILCLAIWGARSSGGGRVTFPWCDLAVGATLTTLFVVVVWPGSVLKVSLLKIPALYLYRIWLGEEYAGVSGLLAEHLRSLLPILVLGSLACFWLFLVHRTDLPRWGPFVVVGGLYGVVMAGFALQPQYLLPALAPFVPLVGVASDRVTSPRRGWILMALVTPLVLLIAWPGWPPDASDRRAREDLLWLGDFLRRREALIDGGHIYQYYLGPDYAIRPITVSFQGDGLSLREGGRYRALVRKDIDGKVVVIQSGRKRFFGGPGEDALLGSCLRIVRLTVSVYDCGAARAGPKRLSAAAICAPDNRGAVLACRPRPDHGGCAPLSH